MTNHDWYNSLLTIDEADKAFIDRPEWFKRIAPLLAREDFAGKYNLCLVHRHVILQPGERMVAIGSITKPKTFTVSDPANIVPSAWTAAGIPFEWKHVEPGEAVTAAPPSNLFEDFSEIVGEDSVLGLSLAHGSLPDGQIWREHVDHDRREHILGTGPATGSTGPTTEVSQEPPLKVDSETCWTLKFTPPSDTEAKPSLVFCTVCLCTGPSH
jgi:hypothetical protein